MEVSGQLHTPGERPRGFHCIEGWVATGAGLDAYTELRS
jgi:hypothetical protein